jgi:hypothetical protein
LATSMLFFLGLPSGLPMPLNTFSIFMFLLRRDRSTSQVTPSFVAHSLTE